MHRSKNLKTVNAEILKSRTTRSLDLASREFNQRGYTKEVYKTKARTLKDFVTRIQEVLNNIQDGVFQKVINCIPSRLRKLVDTTGVYFEI